MAKSETASDSASETEAAAPETAPETPMVTFEAAAQAHPSAEDIVCASPLAHNGVNYQPGAIIPRNVFNDAQFKFLHKEGIIQYRHEAAKPEEFAAEYADLQTELSRKTAENARLIAELEKADIKLDEL